MIANDIVDDSISSLIIVYLFCLEYMKKGYKILFTQPVSESTEKVGDSNL